MLRRDIVILVLGNSKPCCISRKDYNGLQLYVPPGILAKSGLLLEMPALCISTLRIYCEELNSILHRSKPMITKSFTIANGRSITGRSLAA